MQNVECQMGRPASPLARRPAVRAFTMIEIALSLAIIGFALVAILGVLPIGMNTQKANREETIINQDATVFMNAIRNGAKGMDDLTNYVFAITNYVTKYDADMNRLDGWVNGYTRTGSTTTPPFPLINGMRIVGLLSTPKYQYYPEQKDRTGTISNYVVAYVRSLSGQASEKYPQNNQDVQDLSFSYRITSEVVPYGTNYFDPSWVDINQPGLTADEFATRSNYLMVVQNLRANLHDLRLRFRGPLQSRGQVGKSGQAFRTLVGGQLLETNELGQLLYFFDPHNYVRMP